MQEASWAAAWPWPWLLGIPRVDYGFRRAHLLLLQLQPMKTEKRLMLMPQWLMMWML
jgi:hypothetical protein